MSYALRRTRILVWAFAAAVVGAFDVPAEAQQKVLKVVPNADLKVLDPFQTTAMITKMHSAFIYDQLFAWDEKIVTKPQMVETYTVSPDGLRYDMTLRPGLKFHDGSAVTAEDVIPSIKRMFATDTLGQKLAERVASIDKIDDRRFSIVLKQPYPWVEFSLAGVHNTTGIMRAKEALTDPSVQVTDTTGSGPFRFVKSEHVPGARVVYEKNPNYVPRTEAPSGNAGAKVVKVDRVEYIVIPDPATAVNALIKGEVDFIDTPSLDLIPTLEKSPDITIAEVFPLGFCGVIRPNALHPPFNNVKARQALAYMVDQREYAQAAYGSPKFWRECYSYWICGGPNGSENGSADFRKQNIEKAKQLLKEAGYNGEKIVVISASDQPIYNALTMVTVENLKKIGMNVDLQVMDWGGVTTRRAKKDPPAQGGWHIFHTTTGAAPMANPLTSVVTSMTCDQKNWVGWPCDEEAERLRDLFINERDPGKRQQVLDQMNARLWQVVPLALLGQYNQPFAWRKNVGGMLKTSIPVFWNVEKN
jgi:peptide/nickel transport system substrate-binding protein